jgi:hypothetical protein
MKNPTYDLDAPIHRPLFGRKAGTPPHLGNFSWIPQREFYVFGQYLGISGRMDEPVESVRNPVFHGPADV